jgi:orotidine-5'-phosphate decarboxylase
LPLPSSFGTRIEQAFAKYGQLCVGVDPHAQLLEEWGLPETVEGLKSFSLAVLEASIGRVGFIKPKVAFFEKFGAKGFAVLEQFAELAAAEDILVIMDAKRGDIGSTMTGYFDAWLGKEAPFICDALTVSPFLGVGSLAEVMSECLERGKGLFVLAATSNVEGKTVQRARVGDNTLSQDILRQLEDINSVSTSAGSLIGSFGAVVGATQNLSASGLSVIQTEAELTTPILAPGFGAQGAALADARDLFQAGASRVIASVSRSVLTSGAIGLTAAIDAAKLELLNGLNHD